MNIKKGITHKTKRDVSLSLLLYSLPILFMLVYFYFIGRYPWTEEKAKPMLTDLGPVFRHLNTWGLPVIMVAVGIVEWLLGFYKKCWSQNEQILDIASFIIPKVVIRPLLAYFSLRLLPFFLPSSTNVFSWVPFWWGFFIIAVSIDLTEYWYHRLHHEIPFLWRFHRAHHSAPYMGMSVAFRTNIINNVLLSQIYLIAALVYLGLGEPILLFASVRSFITIAAHSSIPWDKPLYSTKWLHPVAWILERTISTPATHHAHHANSNDDGIGHYNGNFGNMFFIWDIIFDTGIITRLYPSEYGIKHYMQEEWYAQFFWPLLKSRKKGSELSAENQTITYEPSA